MIKIDIVPAEQIHLNMICSDFIKDYVLHTLTNNKNNTDIPVVLRRLPHGQVCDYWRHLFEDNLRDPNAQVLVAIKPGSPLAYGWIAFNGQSNTLIYIYVKSTYQGQGIGKSLIEAAQLSYPCKPIFLTSRGYYFLNHIKLVLPNKSND